VLLDAAVNVSASAIPRETTILQTWNDGPNNTRRIVSAGYCAIVSSASFYYLDCGHGNNSVYDDPDRDFDANGGSWCGPYKTWQRVYAVVRQEAVRGGDRPALRLATSVYLSCLFILLS
jgi:hexosaminidase